MDKIKLLDTSFSYDHTDRQALDQVSVSVAPESFVAVLGHNGSGKSTMAKLINALLLPSKGTIWVDGMDTKDDNQLWQIRQTAGMVFQNPDNQIIATIVEEDVAFGPENMAIPRDEIIKRVDEALGHVDMLPYRHKPPHMLSGGQKQRISIAGVLAMAPSCIIFDEPTAMLDPSGRKEVLETILSLKAKGITIVLITHFMEEALLADRILVMHEGKIVKDETPLTLFNDVEALHALSLDVPEIVYLASRLRKEGIPIPSDAMTNEQVVSAICQSYLNK